ncbi:MAG: NAD(P)H-hydrate dehydratase [Pseudomonadota bacterium]
MPARLYTAEQSRAVDGCAIDVHGIPGAQLMARAARAAFERLLQEFGQPECLQILYGPGNNGGDGLLLAVLARGRGIPVKLFAVGGGARSPDARRAEERARGAGLEPHTYAPGVLEDRGVLVDAMLGTGTSGALREEYAAAVADLNTLKSPVFALDIPTGVDADRGSVIDDAVRATATVSFITAKRGLYTGAGAVHAGAVSVAGLDVPDAAFADLGPVWDRLTLDDERQALPPRHAAAHKGDFGRCLLVGGDRGMGGAILLAAEAALRCGVGLARVATRAEHVAPLLARRPECMVSEVSSRGDLEPLLAWPTAIVVGPGLGQDPWGEQLLHLCLTSSQPLLLDADALNLLARAQDVQLPVGSVLTPHPGEAARLLGITVAEVQADRFSAVRTLAERYNAAVVLKGQGSLVYAGGQGALCAAGNPGMASGGMGDVLSGVIGALLAMRLGPQAAARLGTLLHSSAADHAAEHHGLAPLLATDLLPALAALLP